MKRVLSFVIFGGKAIVMDYLNSLWLRKIATRQGQGTNEFQFADTVLIEKREHKTVATKAERQRGKATLNMVLYSSFGVSTF